MEKLKPLQPHDPEEIWDEMTTYQATEKVWEKLDETRKAVNDAMDVIESDIMSNDYAAVKALDAANEAKAAATAAYDAVEKADINGTFDEMKQQIAEMKTQCDNTEEAVSLEVSRAVEAEEALSEKFEEDISTAKSEIQDIIASEESRATQTEIGLQENIEAETSRAINRETELDARIDAVIEKAAESESGITGDVLTEKYRAMEAEAAIDAKVEANKASILIESGRATQMEEEILAEVKRVERKLDIHTDTNGTSGEIETFKDVKDVLSGIAPSFTVREMVITNVDAERLRAEKSENENKKAISDESQRAKTTEAALQAAIDALGGKAEGDLSSLNDFIASVNDAVREKADKADTYTKSDVDDLIESAGKVKTVNGQEGDVVITAESLGAVTDISGKVDKEEGKGLSTEDFTTDLKEKLLSLENFNSTEIIGMIENLRDSLDALNGGESVTEAIDTFNEIIAFLDTFKNTDSLASVLENLKTNILQSFPTSLPANGGNADTIDGYHLVVGSSAGTAANTLYFVI